jgi:hypothetical protein
VIKRFWKRRCKHEHHHDELGETVTVYPTRINGKNLALMDVWVVCDDCGAREPGWKRRGESELKPGTYAAR